LAKVTLIQSNEREMFFYKFILEQLNKDGDNNFYSSVHELSPSAEGFLSFLDSQQLVILPYEATITKEILKLYYEKDIKKPITLTFTRKESLDEYHVNFKYHALTGTFLNDGNADTFHQLYKKLMKINERLSSPSSEYSPVSMGYFDELDTISVDVFLKLSEMKFIKIIRRFQDILPEDLAKYKEKNVKELYVKQNDLRMFVNDITSKLNKKYTDNVSLGRDDLIPLKCHEAVYDSIKSIGLEEKGLSLTNKALGAMMDQISKSNMSSVIGSLLNNGNFISEHSLLLSYIACSTCRKSKWNDQQNIMRLSVASFFHDIKCMDDEVSRVYSLNSVYYEELSYKQKQNFKNHMSEAAKLLSQIDGLPIGVEKIVMNHHEKYDGSGFPRSLDYKMLDPLTSIFVVAHEIVDYIYEVGFARDNIISCLQEMKRSYEKGSFPEVISSVAKSFDINPELLDH
jgi:HD-GYP domain-containing protein (c-di-GMP phosphodiesterase class II)